MFRRGVQAIRTFNFNLSFSMSEGRNAIKRQKQTKLAHKIKEALKPTYLKVDDITIGNSCGQMYNITVESNFFQGKSLVQQHQMVTSCIAEQLKNIHGYNLKTKPSEQKPADPLLNQEKKGDTEKLD